MDFTNMACVEGGNLLVKKGAAITIVASVIDETVPDLRACTGCDVEIGRALGADVVVVGWVQNVSNLILNVNIEVKDTASGASLYSKSVELFGNANASWLWRKRGLARLTVFPARAGMNRVRRIDAGERPCVPVTGGVNPRKHGGMNPGAPPQTPHSP